VTSRATAFCAAAVLALSPLATAQSARTTCRDGSKIVLDVEYENYYSPIFTYHLSDAKSVSAARVEVWDRPQRLYAKQVPVQEEGQIEWRKEPAKTPWELLLAVHDPDELRQPVHVLVGGMRDKGGGPPPLLLPSQFFILEEGGGSAALTIQGEQVSPAIYFVLLEQEASGTWIAREDLPGVLTDLQHVQVQIPSSYLSRPTVLKLESMPPGFISPGSEENPTPRSVTVHVTSKNRPTLTGIEPASIPADSVAQGLTLRLFGSGFTPDSRAVDAFTENAHTTKTLFVSPNELQVKVQPTYLLVNSDTTIAPIIQFRVTNGDELHVSDAQEFHILPTAARPVRSRPTSSINSVSPYPVELMDSGSPAFLELSVYGDNFQEDQFVYASTDEQGAKLKTEYISPHELRAFLPRGLWQIHHYSFRLVTQTPTGACAAEVSEDRH